MWIAFFTGRSAHFLDSDKITSFDVNPVSPLRG